MAVLRRRKVILLATLTSVLVAAAIFTSYYTSEGHMVIVSGESPLLINSEDEKYTGRQGDESVEGIFDNFFASDNTDDDEASLSSVEAKMAHRKKRLKDACAVMKKNNLSPPNQKLFQHEDFKHLIVNKEKEVLYCSLPKVANTNFRRVFLGLQGIVPKSEVPSISGYDVYFTYDSKFIYLKKFKPVAQSEMLHSYQKFLIVRDPLERLLSGYRNKFFHPNARHKAEYHDRATEFYKRHSDFRKRNPVRVDFRSKEMTFNEFLIYWSDVFEAKEYLNEHFVASNQLCNPCNIDYDFIGKYETINADTKYIFDQLKIDIEFPGRNDNYSSVATSTLVEDFYKPVPSWLLKKAWDIIKFDYLIFGYHLPEWFKEKLREK